MAKSVRKAKRIILRQEYKHRLLPLFMGGIFLVVWVVHWPALHAQAESFDDAQYLIKNLLVLHPSMESVWRFLTEVFKPSTVFGYYQPLSMISLMFDVAFGGTVENFSMFHATSLFLHALNAALIVWLAYLLFRNVWSAAIAGLLFGVHPMTVEVVAWVGERKTVLATCFALLSLIAYVLYAQRSDQKYKRISLVLYFLALMSKPTTVLLPLVMLLLDWWPLNRFCRKTLKEKVPFYALMIFFGFITYISQKNNAMADLPDQNNIFKIALILCHNVVFYFRKMIWPVDLTSHYPIPSPLSLTNPDVLIGVTGTFALMAILAASLRWTRAFAACFLMFFIAIFPTMGVIGFNNVLTSDKYFYLPAVSVLLLIAWGMKGLWNKYADVNSLRIVRSGLLTAVLICIVFESIATRGYLVYWKNSEVLFNRMIALAPNSPTLYHDMGAILYREQKLDQAIEYLHKAVELAPDYQNAYYILGNAFAKQNKFDQALTNYKKAISINPNDVISYENIGITLYNQGKLDEAIVAFKQALSIQPNFNAVHQLLAQIYKQQGNMTKANEESNAIAKNSEAGHPR